MNVDRKYKTCLITKSNKKLGEDCVEIIKTENAVVLVVADGAGGIGGGRIASKKVVDSVSAIVKQRVAGISDSLLWKKNLEKLDMELSRNRDAGETTAVIAEVSDKGIQGASVGDSEAWVFEGENGVCLTEMQKRKPLLGSGNASIVDFSYSGKGDILLVATDGLFKYTTLSKIQELLKNTELSLLPDKLVSSVRLRSGLLQDDVGLAICKLTT